MPLTEIKKDIMHEADKEARSIHDSALREREHIVKEANDHARDIRANYEKDIADELKRLEDEHNANLDLQLKRIFLDAREEALKKEINGVAKEVAKAISANRQLYRSLFTNAIKEALTFAHARDLTLIVNRRDADLVRGIGAHVEYENIKGLMIMSQGKEIKIDATLDTVIESRTAEIKSAILESMFPEVTKQPVKPKKEGKKPAGKTTTKRKGAKRKR